MWQWTVSYHWLPWVVPSRLERLLVDSLFWKDMLGVFLLGSHLYTFVQVLINFKSNAQTLKKLNFNYSELHNPLTLVAPVRAGHSHSSFICMTACCCHVAQLTFSEASIAITRTNENMWVGVHSHYCLHRNTSPLFCSFVLILDIRTNSDAVN